jgi:hypothetical protein
MANNDLISSLLFRLNENQIAIAAAVARCKCLPLDRRRTQKTRLAGRAFAPIAYRLIAVLFHLPLV